MRSLLRPRLPWGVAALTGAATLTALDLLSQQGSFIRRSSAEWGKAILTVDGQLSVGEAISIYPVLPHQLATLAQTMIGGLSFEGPAIASALCFAGLTAWIATVLRRDRWSAAAIITTILLLITMAPVLTILSDGLATALLTLLTALLVRSFFELRKSGTVNNAMVSGVLLAAIALTHPIGLMAVLLVSAFFVLALPSDFLMRSASGSLMVLLFPAIALILGFAYIRWLFVPDPWSFVNQAIISSVESQAAGVGQFFSFLNSTSELFSALPLIALAATTACKNNRLIGPLVIAIALPAGPIVFAQMQSATIKAEAVAALAVGITAGIVASGLISRTAKTFIIGSLALGWFIGHAFSYQRSLELYQSLSGAKPAIASDVPDAFAAGIASRLFQDIAVDAVAHPAFAAGRGTGEGLVLANHSSFSLMGALQRPNATFIAVPDPDRAGAGADRLLRMFPTLYRDGFQGYQLRYSQRGWRIFEKIQM